MKVRELIEQLNQMPQDAEVVADSDIECIAFRINCVQFFDNDFRVAIGETYEEHTRYISKEEMERECQNSSGKLRGFFDCMLRGSTLYHNDVHGRHISISPEWHDETFSNGVVFYVAIDKSNYFIDDMYELKQFVDMYIDFLMEGVLY